MKRPSDSLFHGARRENKLAPIDHETVRCRWRHIMDMSEKEDSEHAERRFAPRRGGGNAGFLFNLAFPDSYNAALFVGG